MINTLRNKAGKVVVGAIAVSILAFVFYDLLGNSTLLTGQVTSVGEINGYEVSIEEYRNTVDFQEGLFPLFSGRAASQFDQRTIHEQAWLWLKGQYAFSEQYEALGVEVSDDELWDMLQGKNIDPTIRQFFSDPQTGQFDRQVFNQFYQNRNSGLVDPRSAQIWNLIYPTLVPSRQRLKYEGLLIKSEYATNYEGMASYHDQSDVADISFVFVPYYSLSDSAVNSQVTDAMVSSYYSDNKEDFKTENLRSMEYIRIPILASSSDTLEIREEVEKIASDFATSEDDSALAIVNTDNPQNAFGRYHRGTMPANLIPVMDSLQKGEIMGPVVENGSFNVYKVSDVYEDTTYYSRARHILIRWSNDSDSAKSNAYDEAARIIGELEGGANFALLARQFGTDGTSQRGGDLGWFGSAGDMVKPFQDAVFGMEGTGLITEPIETGSGYHVIEVTEEKTNQMFAIASVSREISPSDRTVDDAFQKADYFQSISGNLEEFRANAANDNLEVYKESDLESMDQFVGDLGNARGMVQWLFRDAEIGSVSDLFEINNNYIIATMTENVPKGYRSMEDVRAKIEEEVKEDLKAKMIIERLTGLSGTLEEIASAYGEDASVFNVADLKLSADRVPNAGSSADPIAVGKIFSMEDGQTSPAFATDNGVLIVTLNSKTTAPEVADYSSFKLAVETTRRNDIGEGIMKVIDQNSDIEDKRYIVY